MGGWCLTGCGILEGLLLLELGPLLQLLGPLPWLLLPPLEAPLPPLPPPPPLLPPLPLPPPPLWFLWYSMGDVKAFKKLRWFSKIWLISWIHVCRTLGLDECKTKVSTASPVLDVRANLQGSLSTFSSKQRQLTLILFLNRNPGMEKPFFLSSGSLNMTICSKRKTRLSLHRGRSPAS